MDLFARCLVVALGVAAYLTGAWVAFLFGVIA
jgi:hypothetical protein